MALVPVAGDTLGGDPELLCLGARLGELEEVPAQRLLGAPASMKDAASLSTTAILVMLFLACLICIAMLNARIRAREVVRG